LEPVNNSPAKVFAMASLWIEKRIQMIPALLLRPNQVFLFIKDMGKQGWWLLAVAWLLTSLAPALAGQFILQAEASTPSRALVEGTEEVNAYGANPSPAEPAPALQYIAAILGPLAAWAAWAAYLQTGALMLGGRSMYHQLLKMVLLLWFPYAVRGLLQTGYILAAETAPGLPGLAGFSPGEGESPLFAALLAWHVLAKLDIYFAWNTALLVRGTALVTRLPQRKALGLVLVGCLLATLMSALPDLIGLLVQDLITGMTFS
jgi:hypothetical protein